MIRNTIQRFMYGRYGNDSLNLFVIGTYLVLYLLFVISGLELLYWISFVLLAVSLFRMLSRNTGRRREENARFTRAVQPVLRWWRLRRTIHRDKEHRYFKCPNCGQQLRVPSGKGRITVTCRNCGATFEEKS